MVDTLSQSCSNCSIGKCVAVPHEELLSGIRHPVRAIIDCSLAHECHQVLLASLHCAVHVAQPVRAIERPAIYQKHVATVANLRHVTHTKISTCHFISSCERLLAESLKNRWNEKTTHLAYVFVPACADVFNLSRNLKSLSRLNNFLCCSNCPYHDCLAIGALLDLHLNNNISDLYVQNDDMNEAHRSGGLQKFNHLGFFTCTSI